ncbi:MAG: DUF2062 domain-containing protein [Reichenbachiella sp.]|uniref:DUF2062 domain-containing protein n=1 Tax=Reichenbachiella sp. TaxID=2184521 RepID=UPI00326379F4
MKRINLVFYYWDKFYFGLKRHFIEVLKTKTSDRSVALGYALGSFIAISPTPGISILLGIAMVAIFKRLNKLSLFFAMAIWNVWTLSPIYWLSYKIGEAIFGEIPVVRFEFEQLDRVFDYTLRFMVGNLILSVPISILSYYFVLWLVRKVRTSRSNRDSNRKKVM